MNPKTYCPMPFVTLTVNPGNYISRCMMSLRQMGVVKKETYSNENFQTLRTNMLNGVWDQVGCQNCFSKETEGLKSQREKWLEREKFYLGEEGIYKNNLSVNRNKIYHLYMNFNNICNFKCRMCGPHFSNAWIPDYKKIHDRMPELKMPKPIPPKQIVDVDKFLNEYGPELSDLRQIWITGGEPFMDNFVYDFFDKLKNFSDLSKITVVINTNASKIKIDHLSKLDKLKSLQINVSVDSTGEFYSYMRGFNYSFDDLDKVVSGISNLRKTQKNLILSINGAYQIYNVLNVEDFFLWADEKIQFNNFFGMIEFRPLVFPLYLQARHAPATIKKQSLEQINRLLFKTPTSMYLNDIKKEALKEQNIARVHEFLTWNKNLDQIRNENLKDIFPELFDEWKKEGIIHDEL
jgi:organic radical activating enzyme